jgi:alcohol dehydrogenase (cytochrome c)/quinohemoprotein ethanol dehydrogenase
VSFSKQTGLVYIPAQDTSLPFTNAPDAQVGAFRLGVDWTDQSAYDKPDNTIERGMSGHLVAWDPVNLEPVWEHFYEGRPAGVLTTAGGLLFQGRSATNEFVAFRADNGEQLWSAPIQASVSAGPISYAIDGEQYVAQVVGGSRPGGYYAPTYARLLVFKLGGTAQLPPPVPYEQPELNPPPLTALAEVVERGNALYSGSCAMCHGNGGANRGMFPDLRYSAMLHSAAAFNAVVIDGALTERGMIAFDDVLDEDGADAIRAYLIARATEARDNPPRPPGG